VDGISSVRAVVENSSSTPWVKLRPKVLKSPMKVIFGSVSSSVRQGAGWSEIEQRDVQRWWAGPPPPQCYGASRRPLSPTLRQVPWWELGFELPRHSKTIPVIGKGLIHA
jgi:hypothetical protein